MRTPPLPALSGSVLLLVDLQRIFVDRRSPAFLRTWPKAEPRARALLSAFRAARRPVIWTRHVDRRAVCSTVIGHFGGRPFRSGDPLTRFGEGWTPEAGEKVLEKCRYSAWAGTRLDRLVGGGAPIVVAGVTTHRCILSTAIEAASRDRICIVASDACATSTRELHAAALSVLARGICHAVPTAEIVAALNRGSESGR